MAFDALSELEDDALLVLYANGDRDAARLLTARLAPRLLGHAQRLLGDRAEAEDVVQEAMLRLWRIAPDWRPGEAKFSTWLHKVALNLCYDRLRKRKPKALEDAPEPVDDRATAHEEIEADERTAIRASANVSSTSSASRSTPGPQATRWSSVPQFGQASGTGSLWPQWWHCNCARPLCSTIQLEQSSH